jgi:glycosyltransferase involved in cell wall biosynthesis
LTDTLMARVAVIIPVFNGAETVGEAIDSVLAQTFRDLELIVVDDGSIDATPAVLDRYGGAIRSLRQNNAGISAARNAALRASTSEFVALLDCDDLWYPTMLERCVAALDHDDELVLAYTNLEVTDSNGTSLASSLVGTGTAHAPTLDEMLTQLWPIMPSAVLMRRKALEAIGGFAEEFRTYGYEDVYCWMRLREIGSFQYIPEGLVKWRFATFPRPLKRVAPNPQAQATFARLVRERWGRDVGPLLRSRERASRSIFGYIGLLELRNGNTTIAREAFRRALRLDRWRFKNYLRLVRTYLPSPIARALGGRTTRRGPRAKPEL